MLFNGVRLTIKSLQSVNSQRLNYGKTLTQLKNYSNWYHRQPSKIVNEEEILQSVQQAEGPNEFLENIEDERKPLKPRLKKKLLKKKITVTSNDLKLNNDGTLNITELKEDDHILTSLMMSVRSKKVRDKNSKIILEGHRLIVDAIESGAIPEIIVFSRNSDVSKISLPDKGVKLFKVPYRAFQIWSTLVTPPGIMGFFKLPAIEQKPVASDALPMTIVCDNVRDPGNLGSILRAAAAVGCKKLITLKGCVDIWEPKVLKTAAGAHFRLPIFATKTWDDLPTLIDPEANVYVADNHAFNMETDVDSEQSSDTVEATTEVHQPEELDSETESEIQQSEELNSEPSPIEINSTVRNKIYYKKRQEKLAKRLTDNIPVVPYYAVDYTTSENIVIIGGETEGLSLEALDLVDRKSGIRINIPMTNGVDSLNTGTALGIIAFEFRRQFVTAKNKNNN